MLCLILAAVAGSVLGGRSGVVKTAAGLVRGRTERQHGVNIDKFFGIPYAAAPIGSLRWAPTAPFDKPWGNTVREATQYGHACMQTKNVFLDAPPTKASEDCLFLNIYRRTPASTHAKDGDRGRVNNSASSTTSINRSTSARANVHTETARAGGANVGADLAPVLFFIHGGCFTLGSGSFVVYDAAERVALSALPTVIVTINYRLDTAYQHSPKLPLPTMITSRSSAHALPLCIPYTWRLEIETDYAGTMDGPDGLSYLHYDSDDESPGEDELFPLGYEQLFGSGELDASRLDIKLNAHVVSISSSSTTTDADGGEAMTVQTADGKVEAADAVIVTLPLGVLKQHALEPTSESTPASTLFNPPLPPWKQDAIRRLGVSLLNKVVLRFATAWWPKSDVFYHTSTEFPLFVNYAEHTGQPVLVGFYSSTHAWGAESCSDAEITAQCMAALKECLGAHAAGADPVPAPAEVVITRWGTDPCSMGAYTHIKVGATSEDCDALAKPVGSTLFFAGEATCVQFLATVHGAYISGQRAAQEAILAAGGGK